MAKYVLDDAKDFWAFHGQSPAWIRVDGDEIELHLATSAKFGIEKVWTRIEPDNEESLVPMTKVKNLDSFRELWQSRLKKPRHSDATIYAFKMICGDRQVWLHAAGFALRIPPRNLHFRYYHTHHPPEWLKDQIFYQVMPDRFCPGDDDSFHVKTGEYKYMDKPVIRRKWGDKIINDDDHREHDFFGGDLYGIVKKMKYIEDLGATALYLTPVFCSPSNHGYDTTDYFHVKGHYGGDRALAKLSEAVHARGMKLILDAVINHTSVHHPWFDRFKESPEKQGAYDNPKSPYRQFYIFRSPTDYVAWKNYPTLPKLDLSNPEVRSQIYEGDKCMIAYWLKEPFKIDGWRLDAIHMIGKFSASAQVRKATSLAATQVVTLHFVLSPCSDPGEGETAANNAEHVRMVRKCIKKTNPDAACLGEHFHESTAWIQGDQEDCSFNYYGFMRPLLSFLGSIDSEGHPIKIKANHFGDWLIESRTTVPWSIQLCEVNVLDSHDTRRLLSVVGGNIKLMKAAVVFLFTMVGVPCIYYGDEIGMMAENDPYCRACMEWDETKWNTSLLDWYRLLIKIRKSHRSLREGEFIQLYAHDDYYCFARFEDYGNKDVIVVLINRGDKSRELDIDLWKMGVIHNARVQSLLPPTDEQADVKPAHVEEGILYLSVEPYGSYVLSVESVAAA